MELVVDDSRTAFDTIAPADWSFGELLNPVAQERSTMVMFDTMQPLADSDQGRSARRTSEELPMSPRIRTCLTIGLLAVLAGPAGIALAAGTPDGVTPATEAVCSKTKGPAYGLCVAYCEANDCELDPGSEECTRLRENYRALTGASTLPCDLELN